MPCTNGNLPSPEAVAQVFRRLSDEFLIMPVPPSEAKSDKQVATIIGMEAMPEPSQIRLAEKAAPMVKLLSWLRQQQGGDELLEQAYELWRG